MCIYPDYNLWIMLNFLLLLINISNKMFNPVERFKINHYLLSDDYIEKGTIIILFTVNIILFLIHFNLEPIGYALGYCN